jgi:hypothetical protein
MNALGQFRVVDASDLVAGVYRKEVSEAVADLRSMHAQGLIRSVSFRSSSGSERRVHTLTPVGRELVSALSPDVKQVYWSGIVKPAELEHDVLLYRAYIRERSRIRQVGFSEKRVVLDYELKRKHFARVNKPGAGTSYRDIQAESARELHLPVVDGHVTFPDFRVEYEDDRGDVGRVDVEVATGNYREKHLAAKAAAGFRVYADGNSGGRLSIDGGAKLPGHVFRQERNVVLSL